MKNDLILFNNTQQKRLLFPMIVLCYFAVAALFLSGAKHPYPESWTYQFLALLTVNFAATMGIFLVPVRQSQNRGLAIIVLFIVQLFCKYIMTKPFSGDIWFEFFLIIIMFLEGILVLSSPELLVLTLGIIVSVLLTDHSGIFWGVEVPIRKWETRSSLFLLTMLISGLSVMIKQAHILLLKYREMLGNQKQIIQKLSASNTELQSYANMAEERSMMNERLKLTREIHDTVGYTMTNLLMMLEASTDLLKTNPAKLEQLLYQALDITKNGHEEIRQSLRTLRNTKVKEKNSVESVRHLTAIFMESTGVDVQVEFGNLPWKLNRKVDHIIYRFLQEAMTNALTHGDAKNIDIRFWLNDNIIRISIEDDGKGSKDIEQGIGLKGMSERLAEVSGTLNYENSSTGFLIRAEIPWINTEIL